MNDKVTKQFCHQWNNKCIKSWGQSVKYCWKLGALPCAVRWLLLLISLDIIILDLPPSVVMSQKTFKGFPLFSGSIQYSPSPLESPESWMSLQEWAGWLAYKPFIATRNRTLVKIKSNSKPTISAYHSSCSCVKPKRNLSKRPAKARNRLRNNTVRGHLS